MKSLIRYLNLNEVGVIELLFAFYPLLAGYSLFGIPLYLLLPLLIDIWIILKGNAIRIRDKLFTPVLILMAYIILHQLFIMLTSPLGGSVALNMLIGVVLILFSFVIISPCLRLDKLIGALNWAALVSVGGLIFHVVQYANGQVPTPLSLPVPILENPRMERELLEGIQLIRPHSFFGEPQAYASFIIVPLAIALWQRKFVWAAILTISLLLSLSTTGIVFAFLIVIVYALSGKGTIPFKMTILLFGAALLWVFLNADIFTLGLEKIADTTMDNDIRLYQGRKIVTHMNPTYYLFGAPYSTALEYVRAGEAQGLDVTVYEGGEVYMPTFWWMIFFYGLVGLFLYLSIYYKFFFRQKTLWPLGACLIAGLFSNTDGSLGAMFLFDMCFAYSFIKASAAARR